MSATIISFYTGEPVGPATLEAMQYQARRHREARDAELVRQLDEYVRAYEWAWVAGLESP